MSTFKYYVRYKNGPSIANVNWNVVDSSYPNPPASSSGLLPVSQNTWTEVYDSGIDEFNMSQSLLSIDANLQSNPFVSSNDILCNSYLIMTASLNHTLSLNVSNSSSIILSGSLTGSFVNPQWNYISSTKMNVTESIIHYISSSFIPRNKSQQFDSFLQANTLYNFTIGTSDPTFQPQNITWIQISGPAPLWFMTSTTASATLVASASISGSYSVVAKQNTTNPQLLTVSQSLSNSSFSWSLVAEPSNSLVYINSSSIFGNGISQSVSVSASVGGNYIFGVTEQTQYSFNPTASIVSSSGASITLNVYNFSQSGQYTYALSAYNLCNSVVSDTVQINVIGNVPVVSSSVLYVLNSTPFTYVITASNNPTTYNVTGLPSGSSFNSSTGLISVAAFTGSVTTGITASNSFGSGYGTVIINAKNYATFSVGQFSGGIPMTSIKAAVDGGSYSTLVAGNYYALYQLKVESNLNEYSGGFAQTSITVSNPTITLQTGSLIKVSATGITTLPQFINYFYPSGPIVSGSTTITGSISSSLDITGTTISSGVEDIHLIQSGGHATTASFETIFNF